MSNEITGHQPVHDQADNGESLTPAFITGLKYLFYSLAFGDKGEDLLWLWHNETKWFDKRDQWPGYRRVREFLSEPGADAVDQLAHETRLDAPTLKHWCDRASRELATTYLPIAQKRLDDSDNDSYIRDEINAIVGIQRLGLMAPFSAHHLLYRQVSLELQDLSDYSQTFGVMVPISDYHLLMESTRRAGLGPPL